MSARILFLILAAVAFGLAAFGVGIKEVNLVDLGFCFVVISWIVNGYPRKNV